jgi:oligogalacturonide lyase
MTPTAMLRAPMALMPGCLCAQAQTARPQVHGAVTEPGSNQPVVDATIAVKLRPEPVHKTLINGGDTTDTYLTTKSGNDGSFSFEIEVATGKKTWYHLERNEWSIHFNVTRNNTLFCVDGGDELQVARAKDGQWIYLLRPELMESRGLNESSFAQPGVLHAEKLVNMAKHNYRLEPNVSFTPDQKWVVFRSNMLGPTYAFAVEVAKP